MDNEILLFVGVYNNPGMSFQHCSDEVINADKYLSMKPLTAVLITE